VFEPQTYAVLMLLGFFGLLMIGVPVAVTLATVGFVFGWLGFGDSLFNLLPARVFGVVAGYQWLAIPLFVFMGVMLEKSRLADDLLDVMGHIAGGVRGGMGVGIVLFGVLMGATTGIVGATVITLGLLTLPTLLRRGFHLLGLAVGIVLFLGLSIGRRLLNLLAGGLRDSTPHVFQNLAKREGHVGQRQHDEIVNGNRGEESVFVEGLHDRLAGIRHRLAAQNGAENGRRLSLGAFQNGHEFLLETFRQVIGADHEGMALAAGDLHEGNDDALVRVGDFTDVAFHWGASSSAGLTGTET
jgi:hypothetical protein